MFSEWVGLLGNRNEFLMVFSLTLHYEFKSHQGQSCLSSRDSIKKGINLRQWTSRTFRISDWIPCVCSIVLALCFLVKSRLKKKMPAHQSKSLKQNPAEETSAQLNEWMQTDHFILQRKHISPKSKTTAYRSFFIISVT